MTAFNRHPGGSRDLVQTKRARRKIPAFAGMTMVAALMLGTFAACSSEAEDAPAGPPQGGPPPPPAPITRASRPNAGEGEKLYVEYCVMCHGPNGMGYGLLARRGGKIEPNLEKRKNLPKELVTLAVRTGIGNMPAVPKGELSDADLAKIADYLASGAGPAQ